MAAKVKVFTLGGTPPPMLPNQWGKVVGARQGNVIGVAYSKADMNALLTDRGISQVVADNWCRTGRIIRTLGSTWRMLADAGVVELDRPGVYCSPVSLVRNSVVARIEPDGTPVVAARLDYDGMWGGRGLYVADTLDA